MATDLRKLSDDELLARNQELMAKREAVTRPILNDQRAIAAERNRRAVLARFEALGPQEREILKAALAEAENDG